VFSRDESRILTWGSDKTARLWDAQTGQQIGPALQHEAWVDGAMFNRDESRILTWSGDPLAKQNDVRLWDARTGQQIGPALQHPESVKGAVFSRDESRILTWSGDQAQLWDVGADYDFPADKVKNWVQAATGAEMDVETRQVNVLTPEHWRQARDEYERVASAHARVCKYPGENQWLLLHGNGPR
jgi:WD40 repeat protein